MQVDQSIIVTSDGGPLDPQEADYIFFVPAAELPPQVLIGIVMRTDKEKKQVLIDDLAPKGAAEKVGIQKDDIVLRLDDEPISTIEEVKIIMLSKNKGDKIKLEIQRPRTFFSDAMLTFEIEL